MCIAMRGACWHVPCSHDDIMTIANTQLTAVVGGQVSTRYGGADPDRVTVGEDVLRHVSNCISLNQMSDRSEANSCWASARELARMSRPPSAANGRTP